MQKISRQQLINRRDFLSDNLREALASEQNANALWQICEAQHLSEDKIRIVATLTGDVILGFLHPEDLASEIKKDLNLIPELANLIASEIDRKIFTSIRSEIEKVYSPVSEGEEGEEEAEEPRIAEQSSLRGAREDEITSPSARNDDKGEAEKSEMEKPIPIEIRRPEAFIVNKVEPPIKIIGMEEEENHRITNQDEYTNKDKEVKELAVSPSVELRTGEAEPMIIHEETELKPLSETKKSLKSLGGLFGFLKGKGKSEERKEESPVKAEIEGTGFSKEVKKIIEEFKPIETKIKVVDYTELPDNESGRIYESKDENRRITNQDEYANKNNEGKNVANEPEPPIKIIDSIRGTPEFIEAVEADKRRIKSPNGE